jgi:hypothetical protein
VALFILPGNSALRHTANSLVSAVPSGQRPGAINELRGQSGCPRKPSGQPQASINVVWTRTSIGVGNSRFYSRKKNSSPFTTVLIAWINWPSASDF